MTQLMTVQDASSRQANSARGPFTIYEVLLDGTQHRARKPIYDLALTLKGQQVYAETRSENKNGWDNYYVDALMAQPDGGQAQVAQTQAEPQPQPTHTPVPSEKDRTIWRQTATKVASDLREPGESEQDFWRNVEKLIWFYETGQHPFVEDPDDIPFG